jgi:hypothetical protein
MAVVHLDPWTDIVNVSWATPSPFMCFAMDIARGPTAPFQENAFYAQPYDWSATETPVPLTEIVDDTYGKYVTAVRLHWYSQRLERRGTYSSPMPQEGVWSGGAVPFTANAIPTVYRLVGTTWTGVTTTITPTGLPDLSSDIRTFSAGVVFAGHGFDGCVDPMPTLQWDALSGSTITPAPVPPGTSSPWKDDTSTTIRLKGLGMVRVGEDGDGKVAKFNFLPPGFQTGPAWSGSIPYTPSLPVQFMVDGSLVSLSGSYPESFADLSVSRAGMTWTFQGRTYNAVAFCRAAPATVGLYPPGPGRMWILGELQPL